MWSPVSGAQPRACTRREAVRLALAAGIAALLPVRALALQSRAELRIGLLHAGADHPDVRRGFELGVTEAARAAELLRGRIDASSGGSVSNLAAAGCTVIVGAAAPGSRAATLQREASERGVLYLNAAAVEDSLRSADCGALGLHVVPSRAMRIAAAGDGGDEDALPVAWHERLFRYGAEQLNDRYRHRFGRSMTEQAWCGWMAVKIAWEAALRARSADGSSIAGAILQGRLGFDGHKGRALRFDAADRQLYQPLYAVADGGERRVPAVRLRDHGRPPCGR